MAKATKTQLPGKPAVGLIMGSQSDWATMKHAADTLEDCFRPSDPQTNGSLC